MKILKTALSQQLHRYFMAQMRSSDIIGTNNSYGMHCNWYWTGGSVGVRNQYNVSSVVRNAQGNYTINFSNTFAYSSYAVDGQSRFSTTYVGSNWAEYFSPFNFSTNSVQVHIIDNGDVSVDYLEDPSAGNSSPYGQSCLRIVGRF